MLKVILNLLKEKNRQPALGLFEVIETTGKTLNRSLQIWIKVRAFWVNIFIRPQRL